MREILRRKTNRFESSMGRMVREDRAEGEERAKELYDYERSGNDE